MSGGLSSRELPKEKKDGAGKVAEYFRKMFGTPKKKNKKKASGKKASEETILTRLIAKQREE